jgi:ribonucleoside-diphosphate reductase beta chain
MTINSKIFNTNKTDYKTPSLFLGQDPGLFDSINKAYPEIWKLYKKLKALDWDENEQDYTSCNLEFKTCHKDPRDMMLMSLAWQWESDSIAARCLLGIASPFISSSELTAYWTRVQDNEVVHAAAYSEIVRSSFDDPDEVLKEILEVTESLKRISVVSDIFSETHDVGHKLALGLVDKNSQEVYNSIFMFVCALYVLERIQFMASFAITFAICDSGLFQPIGSIVQKICQDEYEIHSKGDRIILDYELRTDKGLMAFSQCRDKIKLLIDSVVNTEFNWVDILFDKVENTNTYNRSLVGLDAELTKQWVLYNAKEVYSFFSIESEHELPKKNPISFIEEWINSGDTQGSPQEDRPTQYLLGAVVDDLKDKVIEVDF